MAMTKKTKKTETMFSDPEMRETLPIRRAPYTWKLRTRLLLLLYRLPKGDSWGVRTEHGDRVVGECRNLDYEGARAIADRIAKAEALAGS